MQDKVSETGIICAVGLSFFGTIGHYLTQYRADTTNDWFWIAVFVCALLTLSGAVVGFDPKRLIK